MGHYANSVSPSKYQRKGTYTKPIAISLVLYVIASNLIFSALVLTELLEYYATLSIGK